MSEFLRAYLTVAVFASAAGLLVAIMLGASKLLRPDRPSLAKSINYESGVDPVGAGFGQSQVRYYIFALLFVMFDVETVFLFPWAVRLESSGAYGLGAMAIFIIILGLGELYAWRKGVLKWA